MSDPRHGVGWTSRAGSAIRFAKPGAGCSRQPRLQPQNDPWAAIGDREHRVRWPEPHVHTAAQIAEFKRLLYLRFGERPGQDGACYLGGFSSAFAHGVGAAARLRDWYERQPAEHRAAWDGVPNQMELADMYNCEGEGLRLLAELGISLPPPTPPPDAGDGRALPSDQPLFDMPRELLDVPGLRPVYQGRGPNHGWSWHLLVRVLEAPRLVIYQLGTNTWRGWPGTPPATPAEALEVLRTTTAPNPAPVPPETPPPLPDQPPPPEPEPPPAIPPDVEARLEQLEVTLAAVRAEVIGRVEGLATIAGRRLDGFAAELDGLTARVGRLEHGGAPTPPAPPPSPPAPPPGRPATVPKLTPPAKGTSSVQLAAEAFARLLVDGEIPGDLLAVAASRMAGHMKPGDGTPNLLHMGLALGAYQGWADCQRWLSDFYDRTVLDLWGDEEGGSPGYTAGYQTLPALVTMLYGPAALAAKARTYLRRVMALSVLCTTSEARVVMPAGRVYVKVNTKGWNAGGEAPYDDRLRAVLGFGRQEPSRGTGFWQSYSSTGAWPWRERGGELAAKLFSAAEREAMGEWVLARKLAEPFLAILREIRLDEGLNVLAWAGNHVAWLDTLTSYGGGANAAQPAARAQDGVALFLTAEPPCRVRREGDKLHLDAREPARLVVSLPELPAEHWRVRVDGDGLQVSPP